MPRGVWLSNAAVLDLERIREWLTQPGAGIVAATKLADLLESLADLPDTAMRYRARFHFRIARIWARAESPLE